MFHETASRKLLVFTLYVNPYMSNGSSHFNLFLIRRLRGFVASDLGLHCLPRPTKWRHGLNELNIKPRALEITSRNFRKRKNLAVGTEIVLTRMYVPSRRM